MTQLTHKERAFADFMEHVTTYDVFKAEEARFLFEQLYSDYLEAKKEINTLLGLNEENNYTKAINVKTNLSVQDLLSVISKLDSDVAFIISGLYSVSPGRLFTDDGVKFIKEAMDTFPRMATLLEKRTPRKGSKVSTTLRKLIPIEQDYIFTSLVNMFNTEFKREVELFITTDFMEFFLMGMGNRFGSCLHPEGDTEYRQGVIFHLLTATALVVDEVKSTDKKLRHTVHYNNGHLLNGRLYTSTSFEYTRDYHENMVKNVFGLDKEVLSPIPTISYGFLMADLIYSGDDVFSLTCPLLERSEVAFKGIRDSYDDMFDYYKNTCCYCGEGMDDDHTWWGDDEPYCEECFHRFFTSCSDCGDYYNMDNMIRTTDGEGIYCDHCAGNNVSVCEECAEVFHTQDMAQSDNGNMYCEYCYDQLFKRCEECDKEIDCDKWSDLCEECENKKKEEAE